MRILGLDLGTKTLGIAISDELETIASPYKVVEFKSVDETINVLQEIIERYQIKLIVLGLPKNMDGSLGFAAERSISYKMLLEKHFKQEIILVDERLSTVEALNILLDEDLSRKKRKKKVDGVAASIILDTYLRMRGINNGK